MVGIEESASGLAELSRYRIKPRTVLGVLAVLLGASIYSYVVNIHDANKNLFSQVWRGIKQERYTLFSGSPGGFYIEIGKALQENTGGDAPLAIVNVQSTGGLANAVNVMTTPNSFGLVQEDTLPEKDFIRDHIRYVTPLYLERMHIIYDHAKYEKVRERWLKNHRGDKPPEFPSLGPAVHLAVKEFFRLANVSTGPAGSGSRIFAGYMLEYCKIGPINDRGLGFAPAMKLLTEQKGMDIVFTIAGAPLNLVEQALALDKEDTKLKLMSIDSALVPALNQRYGIKLRGSSFKGKYDGYDNTPTIGSYAFLIASKDIANSAIMALLKVLDQSKNKIVQDLRISAGKQFQLDEFPFYESFKQQHQSFLMELLRNLLIFLVSVSVTTAAVLMFLSWVVSGFKNVGYFRKLTKIYTDYLPENTNLDEGGGAFPKPVIYHNQTGIISKLIVGLKELLVLSSRIRQDYDTGGMTMTHYQHLQVGVANLKETFQRNLAQRFNEYLSSNEIGPATLRHYYTAGYLRREDFGVLEASYADRVRSERKFPEEPSEGDTVAINERRAGSVTVLELSGRLTMGAGSQKFGEKLQSLIADGHLALLVDCGQVDKIDSRGIQALVRGFISVGKRGGKLKLVNLPPRIREVLQFTRLLPIIESFEDEGLALRSFGS